MKKTLSIICGLICIISLMLACAENPDGSCNIAWTAGFLSLSAISGWCWKKLSGYVL